MQLAYKWWQTGQCVCLSVCLSVIHTVTCGGTERVTYHSRQTWGPHAWRHNVIYVIAHNVTMTLLLLLAACTLDTRQTSTMQSVNQSINQWVIMSHNLISVQCSSSQRLSEHTQCSNYVGILRCVCVWYTRPASPSSSVPNASRAHQVQYRIWLAVDLNMRHCVFMNDTARTALHCRQTDRQTDKQRDTGRQRRTDTRRKWDKNGWDTYLVEIITDEQLQHTHTHTQTDIVTHYMLSANNISNVCPFSAMHLTVTATLLTVTRNLSLEM